MGIGKWIRRQVTALAISMASVERDSLSQTGEASDGQIGQEQRFNQGYLSDALERGEITQEVKELRWRMYKIMQATDNVTAEIVGYDEDGLPIVEMKKNPKRALRNVKVDEDEYEVIMVVNNSEIVLGTDGGSDSDSLGEVDGEEREDEDGDDTRTIGEIDFKNHMSNIKSERPVNIGRDFRPKFEIEKYAKRLVVKRVNNTERILEFYISMYPDEFDRKTRLLVSEIKKAMSNPRLCDSLDIRDVNYITDKTMGASDHELYEYSIDEFDKITEYDGNYVLKFKATVVTNGQNIIDKFKEFDLEGRYDRKEAK